MGKGLHQLLGIDVASEPSVTTISSEESLSPEMRDHGRVASNDLAASVAGCPKLEPFGCDQIRHFFVQFASDACQLCLAGSR